MQMESESISSWDLGCPISMLSKFSFSATDNAKQINIQGITVK
jgi:hypothetical protein